MKKILFTLCFITSCSSFQKKVEDPSLKNSSLQSKKEALTRNEHRKVQSIVSTEEKLDAGIFLLERKGSKLLRIAYLKNGTPVTPVHHSTLSIPDHNGKTDGYSLVKLKTGEKGYLRTSDIAEVNIHKDTTFLASIKNPYERKTFRDKNGRELTIGRSDKYVIFKTPNNTFIKDLTKNIELNIVERKYESLDEIEYIPLNNLTPKITNNEESNSKYNFSSCSTEIRKTKSEIQEISVKNSTMMSFGIQSAIPLIALNLTNTTSLDFTKSKTQNLSEEFIIKEKNSAYDFKSIKIDDHKFSLLLGYTCKFNLKTLEIIKIVSNQNNNIAIIKKDFLNQYLTPSPSEKLLRYKSSPDKKIDFFTLEHKLDNALWDQFGILFTFSESQSDKRAKLNYNLKNIVKRRFILDYSKQEY